MKFIAVTSILFLSLAIFSSAEKEEEEISQHVVNGEDANIEDHPYMANVFTLGLPTCGGAILTSRSVLTVS